MQLSNSVLAGFVGGDVEIQNPNEGYLYRGPTTNLKVENGILKIEFEWMAQGEGYPPIPSRWVSTNKTKYEADLMFCSEMKEDSLGRIVFTYNAVGEIVVIFPVNGSKLGIEKVKVVEKEQDDSEQGVGCACSVD